MNKITKYGLIICRDGKLLVNRKYGTKLFLMPGGKPEPNETVAECLIREIKEEHSIELIGDSIRHFEDYEDMAANEPDTIISIKIYTGEVVGEPKISSEIEEQKWFGKDDNPKILSPIIRNKILPALIEKHIMD